MAVEVSAFKGSPRSHRALQLQSQTGREPQKGPLPWWGSAVLALWTCCWKLFVLTACHLHTSLMLCASAAVHVCGDSLHPGGKTFLDKEFALWCEGWDRGRASLSVCLTDTECQLEMWACHGQKTMDFVRQGMFDTRRLLNGSQFSRPDSIIEVSELYDGLVSLDVHHPLVFQSLRERGESCLEGNSFYGLFLCEMLALLAGSH